MESEKERSEEELVVDVVEMKGWLNMVMGNLAWWWLVLVMVVGVLLKLEGELHVLWGCQCLRFLMVFSSLQSQILTCLEIHQS